jgi:NAD(P)H-hydrate epimerase
VVSLTRAQAREVDRIAMERFRIPGIVLMENAAIGIVETLLASAPSVAPVAVVCGPGNNGGDGFAVARHLKNRGHPVRLHVVAPESAYREGSDARINLEIVREMGLEILPHTEFGDAGWIVDALFGTGLDRPIEGPYREAVEAINASGRPTLSVDIASGLDADTGGVLGAAVSAEVTATMVARKVGMELDRGPSHSGRIAVVDIGAPAEAVALAQLTA